jgi:phosphoribosylformylglycinamidine synthase I
MTAASPLRIGVVVFPGINTDGDTHHALETFPGVTAEYLWHKDTDLKGVDGIVIPGGFSYGDYLRCGAIAKVGPIMRAVAEHAARGGYVLGICNGFQILCEAGLLPGALIRNRSLQFRCECVFLKTATNASPFTSRIPPDRLMRLPIAHGEGCYFADPETLARLKANNQVLWRYVDAQGEATEGANPNGALDSIAGICNEGRNVAGLMPHPERASEAILGCADGRWVFESMIEALAARPAATAA